MRIKIYQILLSLQGAQGDSERRVDFRGQGPRILGPLRPRKDSPSPLGGMTQAVVEGDMDAANGRRGQRPASSQLSALLLVCLCSTCPPSAQGGSMNIIASGGGFSCLVQESGSVGCWGLGFSGTTLEGWKDDIQQVDLGEGRTAKAVAASIPSYVVISICVILDNDSVKCSTGKKDHTFDWFDWFGRGSFTGYTILWDDDFNDVDFGSGRTAKAIASGSSHNCSILDDSTVKCWGDNYFGQLGLSNMSWIENNVDRIPLSYGLPTEIPLSYDLPTVNLGTNRTAKALALGDRPGHSCALLVDDSVRCWGSNNRGQLGTGVKFNRDRPMDMGDNLGAVDLGFGQAARSITTGGSHTCAILASDSSVKCWGYNDSGQLGIGDKLNRGNGKGQMGDFLPTVDLGSGRSAVSITAGERHTCAILDNGSVKCWGDNSYGQVNGNRRNYYRLAPSDIGDDASEMGDNLPVVDIGAGRTALAISAGPYHTCAVLNDSSIKCWGSDEVESNMETETTFIHQLVGYALGAFVFLIWAAWTARSLRRGLRSKAALDSRGRSMIRETAQNTKAALDVSKFTEDAGDLKTGKAAVAAEGLEAQLGIPSKLAFYSRIIEMEKGIIDEVDEMVAKRGGSDEGVHEVKELLDYILYEGSSEKEYPNGIRDLGRPPGTTLQWFLSHPNAVGAGLSTAEVVALRLYTTKAFMYMNNPLRDDDRKEAGDACPMPVTTWFASEAIKKLRKLNAPTHDHASAGPVPDTVGNFQSLRSMSALVKLRRSSSSYSSSKVHPIGEARDRGSGGETQPLREENATLGQRPEVDASPVAEAACLPGDGSDVLEEGTARDGSGEQQGTKARGSRQQQQQEILEVDASVEPTGGDGAESAADTGVQSPDGLRGRDVTVHARDGDSNKSMVLWRGLRQVRASNVFLKNGGTEMAFMSTTSDIRVAVQYSMSPHSLLFRIVADDFMSIGASLEWVSAFPAEAEYLYPPLTYLKPTGRSSKIKVKDCAGQRMVYTVIEVKPVMG